MMFVTTLALAALLLTACSHAPVVSKPMQVGSVTELPVQPADSPLRGSALADARGNGVDLQLVYVPAAGFAGQDAAGRPTGATVELLRDFGHWLATTHGWDVRLHWREQADWSRFYQQVKDGQGAVLGVGNVTITDARKQELDFSPPYLRNIAVLVTHAREPELASLAAIGTAFDGMSALAFPGTLHEQRLRSISSQYFDGHLPMREFASNDAIVQALASEARGFAYLDAYNLHRAQEQGLPLRRHAVGDDASESFGVILPHASHWTELLEAFFQDNGGYTQSPRWRAHLTQHLGQSLTDVLLDAP